MVPLEDAIREATQRQTVTAHDTNSKIRVIAGPGSGKSKVIEERIQWLLERGIDARRIVAISFTNASVKDLKGRILKRCEHISTANAVRVSTLHSLALTLLKSAGQLAQYPANPKVLNDWELEAVFDPEFGTAEQIPQKSRQQQIRLYHEALWETGRNDHPYRRSQGLAVTPVESTKFDRFHNERTSVYACVLPGEIVAKCLSLINTGILDPREAIGVDYLIVDEFQDLNPTDLGFINKLIEEKVNIFVAGDDDQSVYSFRYASPLGIQKFTENYEEVSQHELQHCFRCSPAVLNAASALITSTQSAERVAKNPVALHSFAEPAIEGCVYRWRFEDAEHEANGIAQSCKKLIDEGLSPSEILILVRNKRVIARLLNSALAEHNLPFTSLDSNGIAATSTGRALLAILRIACEGEEERDRDYVARRVLLGLIPSVGPALCNRICVKTVQNGLNYRNIFHTPLPNGVFTPREQTMIERVAEVCGLASGWRTTNTLEQHLDEIARAIDLLLGEREMPVWNSLIEIVPAHITIKELSDYIGTDNKESQQQLLLDVKNKLRDEGEITEEVPPKIRVLSMHGAKGLSAQVVFVPALEEGIIPSAKSAAYAGLVQEEARLLYVSITRARALCILSYSRVRVMNGSATAMNATRFATNLGGPFVRRTDGLTDTEAADVLQTIVRLEQ